MILKNLSIKPQSLPFGVVQSYAYVLKIRGSVKKLGFPSAARVRLFEKLSGKLVAETLTDSQGNYSFENLAQTAFFVIAHDPASQYNAIIQDMVVPK